MPKLPARRVPRARQATSRGKIGVTLYSGSLPNPREALGLRFHQLADVVSATTLRPGSA